MTRWSLRRRHPRTTRTAAGAYRLDPPRPDGRQAAYRPDSYPQDARQPDPSRQDPFQPDAFTPGGYRQGPHPQDTAPAHAPSSATEPPASHGRPAPAGAWPDVCEQFGLHLLVLAEQLRISLDELEADEDDPERLQKLYRVDHAVTRMRRASRDLRTLAGRAEEELGGVVTSLLDIIRMALSAIERYTQVSIGRVAEFAVLGYAADDVGELLAALLDNATRYSPGMASVSAHLTEDGSVLVRVEDSGIGIAPDAVAALNAMLAGEVPELDERTGRHTGFPVVHRIARKYSIMVRLAARPSPGNGTIAMVTLPPGLLCEVPDDEPGQARPPRPRTREGSVAVLPTARRERTPQLSPAPDAAGEPERDQGERPGGLPRREPASLRGDKPRQAGQPEGRPETARTPEEESAARRAFADDLTAFSLGSQDPAGKGSS
jgi:hypothetical protein